MAKVIVAASPLQGHVVPALTVAEDLVARGHEVVVYTGAGFSQRALATGSRFCPLPSEGDLDDQNRDTKAAEQERPPAGLESLIAGMMRFFVNLMPAQLSGLHALLADFPADVVVSEAAFLPAMVLYLAEKPGDRPTLVSLGVSPPSLRSVDVPAPGTGLLPLAGEAGRRRHQATNAEFRKMFAEGQQAIETVFDSVGVPLTEFIFDAYVRLTDQFLQLTVPGFEYPRSDAPEHFRCVGALPPDPGTDYQEPQWWTELSEDRPVVVVTQGTVANLDLADLIIPTLHALADLDVLVIAATASEDGPETVRRIMPNVPTNVRLASFVPFNHVLPFADVFVTNGGYGGVQTSLYHGVPLVVAGDTADKPSVAARVEWSGTGINLRSGKPDVADIRAAVLKVLNERSYRDRANQIRKEYRDYHPLDAVAEIVDAAG